MGDVHDGERFIADAGLGKLPIPVTPEQQRIIFQQFVVTYP